jgi:hypothetical protein
MITLLIAGCDVPPVRPFSDVVPMGLDTYMLTREDALSRSGSAVKADLYRRANAFCESKGKQLMPVREMSRDSPGGPGYGIPANAEIQFRCLDSSDPEFIRPTMQSVPDVKVNVE